MGGRIRVGGSRLHVADAFVAGIHVDPVVVDLGRVGVRGWGEGLG